MTSNERPAIRLHGTIAEQVEQTRKLLTTANQPPTIFRHGSTLVRIARDDNNDPIIATFRPAGLAHHLDDIADWYKIDGRSGASVRTSPPQPLVSVLIEKPDIVAEAPIIHQIVTVPVFAPDGSLELQPGYLPGARVWYEPTLGLRIPTVSAVPSAAELSRARHLLLHELLSDFPFVSPADKANAVALCLLPFVRHLIDGSTPMHAANAPTAGTGKGLLLRACLLPAFGVLIANDATIPLDPELDKRITTWLMEGRSHIRFDNVTGVVKSVVLSSALTEPVWSGRILGVSRSVDLPVRCIWSIAGNNLSFSGEMARRTVQLRLDVIRLVEVGKVGVDIAEHPRKRTGFRHADLIAWATGHRAELIWACLTICRAWIVAGRVNYGGQLMASYAAWSNVMGGIMQHMGSRHFLGNIDSAFDETVDETARQCDFLTDWQSVFGDGTVIDATTAMNWALQREDDLFELRGRMGASDKSLSTAFGMAMRAMLNQVHCDLRLERPQPGKYVLRWLGP